MRLARYQRPTSNIWAPFDQWSDLREEINRLFEAPFGILRGETEFFNVWAPPFDLFEDRDNLILRAELPGMLKEEIEISLHENNITVAGVRKSQIQEGQQSRTETFSGRFQRTFSLPKPVNSNKVTATYKDGVLTVTLPKTEESKPKQIEVSEH